MRCGHQTQLRFADLHRVPPPPLGHGCTGRTAISESKGPQVLFSGTKLHEPQHSSPQKGGPNAKKEAKIKQKFGLGHPKTSSAKLKFRGRKSQKQDNVSLLGVLSQKFSVKKIQNTRCKN